MVAEIEHIGELIPLLMQLWPEMIVEEAKDLLNDYIGGKETAVFTHYVNEKYVGLALCCLRYDYVEGCDTSPVGYLEGIVVDENNRMKGIANLLCQECERWAKEKGCTEFASDCELTNSTSIQFHLNIGFKEENRIVCFKKNI